MDHKLTDRIFLGAEASKRDITQPVVNLDFSIAHQKWIEKNIRAYAYWAINEYFTSSVEYAYDTAQNLEQGTGYKNHMVPMSLRFFDKNYGLGAALTLTYVNQDAIDPVVVLISPSSAHFNSGFELLDFGLSYRLPNRHGIINLMAKNILDEKFSFVGQSLEGQRNNRFEETPPFLPGRTFFLNLTLSFR